MTGSRRRALAAAAIWDLSPKPLAIGACGLRMELGRTDGHVMASRHLLPAACCLAYVPSIVCSCVPPAAAYPSLQLLFRAHQASMCTALHATLPTPPLPPALPQDDEKDNSIQSRGCNYTGGAATIAAWLVILITVIVLVNTLFKGYPPGPLQWFEVFYRIGSIIYGGGQVRAAAANGVRPACARCQRRGPPRRHSPAISRLDS